MNYDHLGVILWRPEALERVVAEETERWPRHPRFEVGWDHEAFTYDYLAEHGPDLLAKMQRALAGFKGRLGVASCTYGQPLAQFINEESNIRQLAMARATLQRHFGVEPSVYIMSEHAMHSQMPQILAGCGFKGAVLRTHFMMYGCNPTIAEPVVFWVGLDGSHLRAVPTYPGQEEYAATSDTPPLGYVTLDNRILTDYPVDFGETLETFRRRCWSEHRSY
jgi:hypothetical protein